MGRGGHNLKPVEVKRAEGNPGKRTLGDPIVLGGRALPAVPKYLPERAKTAWRQVAKDLEPLGLLDAVDAPALEALSVEMWIMRAAVDQLKKESLVVEGSQGQPVANPLIGILQKAQGEVRRWGEQFGLTPQARTRLGLQQVKGLKAAQELDKQLGGPKLQPVK